MRSSIFCLLFVFFAFESFGQGFSGGFKAGLNYSNMLYADLETDAAGAEVEENVANLGFLIGALFDYEITSNTGVFIELLYAQKGGRYRYNGDSYLLINDPIEGNIYLTGQRRTSINITNSYVDIPLCFYYKPSKKIRVGIGPSVGFLVSSIGSGETVFTPGDPFPSEGIITALTHNYRKHTGDNSDITYQTITVNGLGVFEDAVPTEQGAYYDFGQKTDNYFNGIDFGLNLDFSYNVGGNLWLGLRLNYGLTDVSNNTYDFSKLGLENTAPDTYTKTPRADKDSNIGVQASLGFSF